MLAILLRLNYN